MLVVTNISNFIHHKQEKGSGSVLMKQEMISKVIEVPHYELEPIKCEVTIVGFTFSGSQLKHHAISEDFLNTKMDFYRFGQNNSGGYHVLNDLSSHDVFIEANPEKAKQSGMTPKNRAWTDALSYTDVYEDDGYDCDCCGSRWSNRYQEHFTGTIEDIIRNVAGGTLGIWGIFENRKRELLFRLKKGDFVKVSIKDIEDDDILSDKDNLK